MDLRSHVKVRRQVRYEWGISEHLLNLRARNTTHESSYTETLNNFPSERQMDQFIEIAKTEFDRCLGQGTWTPFSGETDE